MIKILIDKLARITKNRKKLESELSVKITNRGKEIFIDGKPENEYIAEKVLLALDFGFPYVNALTLKNGEAIFEILNIKDHTERKDLERVRARLIGTKGKTLKNLCHLTDCAIELKENKVGIIGDPELIENATQAIISIIKGAKQGNVYAHLEKNRPKFEPDLGLRKKE